MLFKLLVRFALAKAVIMYGMDLMLALFYTIQGVISTIMTSAGFGSALQMVLPDSIVTAVENCVFLNQFRCGRSR